MNWVLLVMLGQGLSFSADFNSLDACMEARQQVIAVAQVYAPAPKERVICVRKGLRYEDMPK